MATSTTGWDAYKSLAKDQYTREGLDEGIFKPDSDMEDALPISRKAPEGNGLYIVVPVSRSPEQGFSYLPPGTGGDLNPAVTSVTDRALVSPSQMFEQITIEQEVLNRIYNNTTAVMEAFGYKVQMALDSANTRSLISSLYGSAVGGLVSIAEGDVTSVDSTTVLCTCDTTTVAADIFTSMTGAPVEFYRHGSTIAVATSYVVTDVDVDAGTFQVTGTSGDITSLLTATGSYALDVFFLGSHGNDMLGLQYLNENTSTSVFVNINPALSPFYRGQQLSASTGDLNLELILKGAARLRNLKVKNQNIRQLMPHTQWEKLNNDEAALVRHNDPGSKEKGINGFNEIGYSYGSGMIILTSSGLIKNGLSFMYADKKVTRLCSRDWRLDPADGDPGAASTKWLTLVYGNTAAFGRLSTGQQLFTPYIGQTLEIQSIGVNANA